MQDIETERRRVTKWFAMLEICKASDGKQQHSKLKSRGRKGIPDSIRGIAWNILTNSHLVVPDEYGTGGKQLWMKELLRNKLDQKELLSIFKDLSRSMPNHVYFAEALGSGQKALFAVLKCLALSFPEVGYVQGMNFLAAALMTYTTPEDSFAIMVSLMRNFDLKSLFEPGFPGLQKYFFIFVSLLKKYMPKVYKRLSEMNTMG